MDFKEKDLEDMLYDLLTNEEIPREDLEARGLAPRLKDYEWQRQVKIGSYGVIDLLGVLELQEKNEIYIRILELKKDPLNSDALDQINRYAAGIKEIFKNSDNPYVDKFYILKTLVGPSIEGFNCKISRGSDWVFTLRGSYTNIIQYNFDAFKGIQFKISSYSAWHKSDWEDGDFQKYYNKIFTSKSEI